MSTRDVSGRAAADAVDVLWTSGWDSTFRVLQLLFETDAVVQPWYVLDPGRRSTAIELATMEEIREAVGRRDPALRMRLRPTILRRRDEIPADPRVTAMVERLRERGRVGSQYDWLARFARHEKLDRLEMGLHDPHSLFGRNLNVGARWIDTSYGWIMLLADEPAWPELELFRPFAFPLMGLSKVDMQRRAEAGGYADLLELAWFCHKPRRGRACGLCNPCQQVFGEALTRRMPLESRILGRGYRYLRRLRTMFRKRKASPPA